MARIKDILSDIAQRIVFASTILIAGGFGILMMAASTLIFGLEFHMRKIEGGENEHLELR